MTSKRISKILEFKQFTKDIYETELKKSLETLQSEKTKLACIETDIQKTITQYNQSQQDGSINIQEFDFFYNYLRHMNKQAEKQKSIISKKSLEVQKKKDEVIDAHKEKEMVKIIHNKLLNEEVKDADKKEQKEIDLNFLHKKLRK